MTNDLRRERDQYVAFAFAAADLLIELDGQSRIAAAKGAAQSVCGHDQGGLAGAALLDLIADDDKPIVRRALAMLTRREGSIRRRCGSSINPAGRPMPCSAAVRFRPCRTGPS